MEVTVVGIEALEKELREKVKQAKGEFSEKFVTMCLIQIAAHTAPYVPVDLSTLINSEYRKTKSTPRGWLGEIGYGAEYAGYVHDGGPKNWQKAGASDQFLSKGVADFIAEDLDAVIKVAFKGLANG